MREIHIFKEVTLMNENTKVVTADGRVITWAEFIEEQKADK